MTAALHGRGFAESRADDSFFSPVRGRNRAKRSAPPRAFAAAHSVLATETMLLEWLDAARPGDRLTYHVGHLAADRFSGAGKRRDLDGLARRVVALAAEGRVVATHLAQPDGCTAYIVIKTKRVAPCRFGAAPEGGN